MIYAGIFLPICNIAEARHCAQMLEFRNEMIDIDTIGSLQTDSLPRMLSKKIITDLTPLKRAMIRDTDGKGASVIFKSAQYPEQTVFIQISEFELMKRSMLQSAAQLLSALNEAETHPLIAEACARFPNQLTFPLYEKWLGKDSPVYQQMLSKWKAVRSMWKKQNTRDQLCEAAEYLRKTLGAIADLTKDDKSLSKLNNTLITAARELAAKLES